MMVPFERTWPYELLGNDVYVRECPFCEANGVFLPMKKKELAEIHEGKRKLLIFPCCYNRLKLVDTDADYLLADRTVRKGFSS